MVNKQILSLVLVFFGLQCAYSFGMEMQNNQPQGQFVPSYRPQSSVAQQIPSQQDLKMKEMKAVLNKCYGNQFDEASPKEIQAAYNNILANYANIEKEKVEKTELIRQIIALHRKSSDGIFDEKQLKKVLNQRSVDDLRSYIVRQKEEQKAKKESAAFRQNLYSKFQVVRAVGVALASSVRINHYARKVCAVLGRHDLENSFLVQAGSLAAAGTVALLDYWKPSYGFVGLSCFFGMDALLSNLLGADGKSTMQPMISPRIG